MSVFIPGHSSLIHYQADDAAITESSDGLTPATIAALEGSPTLVGYTNVPETVLNLNNTVGYSGGMAAGAYGARGMVEVEVGFTIRFGLASFLTNYCLRADDDVDLPDAAIHISNSNGRTIIRKAKCQSVELVFDSGGEGGGGPLLANVRFWGITATLYQSALTATPSQIRAFNCPLMWHDLRTLSIKSTDYRKALVRQSWSLTHNLERKPARQNFGDNQLLSRTSYFLLPHLIGVTGEISFHSGLTTELVNQAKNSQDWGNVSTFATDSPAIPDGQDANYITVTANSVMPSRQTENGGELSTEITYTVPVVARNLAISTSAPETV